MANNLQKMFVIVPATKGGAFKTAHTGASITSSDNYYDKIAFLEDTGEICTHGKVYALNADLLSADANTPGSVQNQVKTAVDDIINQYLDGDNHTTALDTLHEVITWIENHKGTDGSAHSYLLQDIQNLLHTVYGDAEYYTTVSEYNTAHAGDDNFTNLTEEEFNNLPLEDKIKVSADSAHSLVNRVALLESTEATRNLTYQLNVADTNNVVSLQINQSTDGKIDGGSTLTVATESLNNVVGMQYNSSTGTWSAHQNSTVQNANALAVASDIAAEIVADEQVIATALNAHESRLDILEGGESTTGSVYQKIAAMKDSLDADITSDDNTLVTVEVVEVDGQISDVVVTKRSAGVSGVRYVAANGQTAATNPTLTVSDTTGGVDGADVVTIKNYIDDKAQQLFDNSIDSLDVPSTAVNNAQNGVNYTSFTYSETNGLVSITGLSNAIGAVSESNDTMVVTTNGLIDAQALATTLNAIDPWFTYPEN